MVKIFISRIPYMATKTTKPVQAKRYCFTLNNYTEDEERRLKELNCEWIIFGHEIAPTTGTPHLQGAICYKNKRNVNVIKKLFPRMWVHTMDGQPHDSRDYCMKADATGYFEKGIMPESQGKKGGQKKADIWHEARQAAKEGRFEDIPDELWVKYRRSFQQEYDDNKQDADMDEFNDKDLKDHFLWLYGPTGTGKSHTAHRIAKEINPDEKPYIKDLNKWWNGYSKQRVTIIEEADPERCEHLASYFKKWADKWAFTAECKGTVLPSCRPEYIIVTSNYCIRECFPKENDYLPLERRFTEQHLPNRQVQVYWPLTKPQQDLAAPAPAPLDSATQTTLQPQPTSEPQEQQPGPTSTKSKSNGHPGNISPGDRSASPQTNSQQDNDVSMTSSEQDDSENTQPDIATPIATLPRNETFNCNGNPFNL